MKRALALVFGLSSSQLLGGGGSGGTPPLLQDSLEIMSSIVDTLPKAYIDKDEFRRMNARLSALENQTVLVTFEGEELQIKKLSGRLVDEKIAHEILPKQ